ncbi:unnamed protein product [Symbiodinium sp. CCMP2592]|nr:unnamed protein product [Symbiodinium sp. CCMP2592]
MAFTLSLHGVPVATSLSTGSWTQKSYRKDQESSRSVLTAAAFAAAAAAAHPGWCWASAACGSRAAPRSRLRMHVVEIVDAEIISEVPASDGNGQDEPQPNPADAEAAAAVIDASRSQAVIVLLTYLRTFTSRPGGKPRAEVLQLVEAWLNPRMTRAATAATDLANIRQEKSGVPVRNQVMEYKVLCSRKPSVITPTV